MNHDRKRYGTMVKAILFGMQSIFAICLAVFIVLLQGCMKDNMLNLGDFRDSDFVESGYFEKTFRQETSNLLEYLQLRHRFERDGVYDEARVEAAGVPQTEIDLYKKYFNQYDSGSSNLYYWIEVGDKKDIYTNLEGEAGETEAVELVRNYGSYLYYDSEAFYFDTNVGGMEHNYYQNMRRYNVFGDNSVKMIIGVDPSFPYEDDFAIAQKQFNKLFPWARLSLIFIIVSGVGWLFCLCYLTVTAGHRREDRDIHLARLDQLKTEVLIALMILGLSGVAQLALLGVGQNYNTSGGMIVAGSLAFLADAVFMVFYLSLARKVKAETFWENSLIHWCSTGIKAFLKERYMSGRLAAYFCCFTAGSLLLAYLAFGRRLLWSCFVIAGLIICVFVYLFNWLRSRRRIKEAIRHITAGDLDYKLDLELFSGNERELAEGVNHIAEGLSSAIQESVRDERMKANMITNVSHDLKTPLTAIINYVGLLKREDIQNEHARQYIDVLEQKSMRLKSLMEDLVEISKISSGNVTLHMDEIDLVELVRQTGGEFNEKLEQNGLNVISKFPNDSVMIYADGRQLWRVIGNLYNNVGKYAMPNTRVYAQISQDDTWAVFSIKNISADLVDLPAKDLTERFVRGDEARTTEGSGLGLSIAKTLTELMNGKFEIRMDADLFCAEVKFRILN